MKTNYTSINDLKALSGAELVKLFNSLPGVTSVKKFTNREVGAKRTWAILQTITPAPAKGKAAQGDDAPRATKGTVVLSLLRETKGVSLTQIMEVTGWQAHSVRGFISGHVGKKLGLTVKSEKKDGVRVYSI